MGNSHIRLDANESPWQLPEPLRQRIMSEFKSLPLNRYPAKLTGQFTHSLAAKLGVDRTEVLLGNGSDELIQLLCLTLGPDGDVLLPTPTFTMYKQAACLARVPVREIHFSEPFNFTGDRLLEEARQGKGLLFLCNPNNPTGHSYGVAYIEELLKATQRYVVVDEAYFEFSGVTALPLLETHSNLIVLRTFSKAWGLAGMRLGYLVTNASLCQRLAENKQPYNVSSFSLLAGRVILEARDYLGWQVACQLSERQRLYSELSQLPEVRPLPSAGSFILFTTSLPSQLIWQELKQQGIYVRYFTDQPVLANYLRVSVGRRHDNQAFLKGLRGVMEEWPRCE